MMVQQGNVTPEQSVRMELLIPVPLERVTEEEEGFARVEEVVKQRRVFDAPRLHFCGSTHE